MRSFSSLGVLRSEDFVAFTRDRCIALMCAVTSIEFSTFKTTSVFHEETAFLVGEFRWEVTRGRSRRCRRRFVVRGIRVSGRRSEGFFVRFHGLLNCFSDAFALDDAAVIKIFDFRDPRV